MLKWNAFGCVAFERRLGQLYMCVEILLYSVILFTSNFTDHVLTAKYLYDKISGIFKWGNPLSGEREREREVKKEYLYFIWEAVPLITERLTNN